VLHGALAVAAGSPAHVEFEEIPTTAVGAGGAGVDALPHGPDYSALKTWIPGGTFQRYDWSSQGQVQPFRTEEHRFVLIHGGPEVSTAMSFTGPLSGYTPLCLTVRGVRLSSSGPVVEQAVTASVCGYGSFPIVDGLAVALNGALPLIALTHPSPRGTVEVAGHTAAGLADAGGRAPNLIVHFADERTAGRLEFLVQAVREAGRQDAATAVVAVLAAGQLTNARYTEGVVYAEDQGDAWERVFAVQSRRRPLTLIVAPGGKVVWQHEGELDTGSLAAALRKVLTSVGSVPRGMLRSSLRIGALSPNFLFDYAPGRQLTLRKLAGRPVTLVFWKSASRPSIEAVRDLKPIVLAINDGEPVEQVKRSATEHGLSATIVTDPNRQIALAYGVNVWPTIVSLDASGLVRAIRYGRLEH
jgi:peroxiredoxin